MAYGKTVIPARKQIRAALKRTIVNNAADKADNVDRMQDVIKIRRGAKAAIVNALVKGTGGSIDLIDMSDSKGAGNADSSVSITNSLNLTGKKLNGTLNTFAEFLLPLILDCSKSVFQKDMRGVS